MCSLVNQCRKIITINIPTLITNVNKNYFTSVAKCNIFDRTPKCAYCYINFNTTVRRNNALFNRTTNTLLYSNSRICITKSKYFNTDKKETLICSDKNVRGKVFTVIEQNKEMLRETEQRLREKSQGIISDFKATKNKMKEKMGEVIERENIYTIPNFLCVSRILLTPYLGMLIIQANFNWALIVLGVAAFTDLLDGWIARTWKNQSSKLGSFLDPMADKILISTLFLTLTYNELIPLALTAMIITRDVLLLAAGFVIRYKSLPSPRTLSKYFDGSQATAQLAPTFISKVNTVVQLVLVGSTLAAPVFGYVDHLALNALWYITGATTVISGFSYITSKNTYKYFKKSTSK